MNKSRWMRWVIQHSVGEEILVEGRDLGEGSKDGKDNIKRNTTEIG
jgi:hypothetical protein